MNRLRIGVVAIAGGVFVTGLWLIGHRQFDIDELEHAHAAWSVAHGLIPYRDFYEHHTPALYLLSAPLFGALSPERSVDAALRTLVASRAVMWLLTALAVGLTYHLTKVVCPLTGPVAGAWAVLLLTTSSQFVNTMMEFRPDVPAVVGVVAALRCVLEAERQPGRATWWRVASGLAFGASMMFTQKPIFAAPGLMIAFAATNRRRAIVEFVAGLLTPIAVVAGWFAAHGAAGALIDGTIVRNIALNADRRSPLAGLMAGILRNLPIYGFGMAGAVAVWRRRARGAGSMLVVALISLAAGIAIIGRVYDQYYVLMLPLFAALGGSVIARWSAPPSRAAAWLPATVAVAAATLFAAVSVMRYQPNDAQLAEMDVAMQHAAPRETVLTGIPGAGTFRPHAWYYFFLVGPFANARDYDGLQLALERGQIRPRLVVFDASVQMMPAGVVRYLRAHYRPLRGDVYIRHD